MNKSTAVYAPFVSMLTAHNGAWVMKRGACATQTAARKSSKGAGKPQERKEKSNTPDKSDKNAQEREGRADRQ